MKSRGAWFSIIFCLLATVDYLRKNIQINNVCDNWLSYYNFYFSSHCSYNPDAGKPVGEIIERLIGVSEFHEVVTEDGYILGVFRMPRKNPKGVILFQHPLTVDSGIWFIQGNMSTAFLFWKAGYDIWLANSRGTTYSQKHVSLKPDQEEFWNYRYLFNALCSGGTAILLDSKIITVFNNFHEMGYYDHPACTSYVKKATNVSKIVYLGHSMATTSSLIFASLRPKQASEDVKVFINLSPTAFFDHCVTNVKPILRFIIPKYKKIGYSLLGRNHTHNYFFTSLHSFGPFKLAFVYLRMDLFGGTFEEFDPALIEMLLSQFGSEVSVKTFSHYVQLFTENKFQMFNYGEDLNLKLYGTSQPSAYPIENITAPFYFVYSTADKVVNFTDVEELYNRMSDKTKIYGKRKIDTLGHIDLHVGLHRNPLVYEPLIEFLDSIHN